MLNKTTKLILNIFPLIICVLLSAQPVLKTMKRLPGTGQTTSYTTTFGEDADYNFNPPFFILNGNGTVTDTVTGLMWQKTDGGEMTIENATIYCDTLTLGGFSDWRLPNCHELFSILNHSKANPALNTTYFTASLAEYWWSSQKQANDASKVWCTNAGGGIGNHPKLETISAGGTKKFHVRAVRDISNPSTIPNHFINNNDGTVTDLLTGLMWKQVPLIDSVTWEQALIDAEGLSFAGYADWRLPDIKELQSINDEGLINPSINISSFTGIKIGNYWSSTTLPNQTSKAWYLDTHFGVTTYLEKTNKNYIVCVRNGGALSAIKEGSDCLLNYKFYPNPSKGKIEIVGDAMIENAFVFDLSGALIFSASPNSKWFEIEISKSGWYCILLVSSKGILQRKIKII